MWGYIKGLLFVVGVVVGAIPRTEVLDEAGSFIATWTMDNKAHLLTFTLDVKTTGWIAFGISNNDSIEGADIVVGGVWTNGSVYFTDRHGVNGDKETPVVDVHQDWSLLEGTEKGERTMLKFSRICDTDDVQDVPFSLDSQRILWFIGSNDTIDFRAFHRRGVYPINILDYPPPPFDPSKHEKLSLTINITMPTKETSSLYMLHRSPKYPTKTSVLAIMPQLRNYYARAHTHHMSIYKCQVPKKGMNTERFFEPHRNLGLMDEIEDKAKVVEMLGFCSQLLYAWSRGARNLYFPEGVGLANGEGGRSEFYFMQISLKNPRSMRNIRFETGVNFYVTSDIPKYNVGILNLAKQEKYFFIPPGASNFHVSGQCSSECTQNLPSKGINVFAIQLHAHNYATKLSIHHVRNETELPLIATDQHFNSSFQNIRNRKPVLILPGDKLFIDCAYDNNGSRIRFGGMLDDEEMCDSLLYFYPYTSLTSCGSGNLQRSVFPFLGITNTTTNSETGESEEEEDPLAMVLSPSTPTFGMNFKDYVLTSVNWTPQVLSDVEKSQFKGDQLGSCLLAEPSPKPDTELPGFRKLHHIVTFPNITKHVYRDITDAAHSLISVPLFLIFTSFILFL